MRMDPVVFAVAGHATSALAAFSSTVRTGPQSELECVWNFCFRRSKSRREGFVFAPWEKWCEWKMPTRGRGLQR